MASITKSMISFSKLEIAVIKSISKTEKTKVKKKTLAFPTRKLSEAQPKIPKLKKKSTSKVKKRRKESSFEENKKYAPCRYNPKTLYHLSAEVVDKFPFPNPFKWSDIEVRNWIIHVVGLPQYAECFMINHINGKRLINFEDPSIMPKVGITSWHDIKHICHSVRKLFSAEMVTYFRSIGLPRRLPMTLMNEFKSKTGPIWGIRQNYFRSEILRWYRILDEEPEILDHWDLVWYQRQIYPKTLLARVPCTHEPVEIPHYVPRPAEKNYEITVKRKFRIQKDIPDAKQRIWVDKRHYGPLPKDPQRKRLPKYKEIPSDSNLLPKKINTAGLAGHNLVLARRKMPRKKFGSFPRKYL